MPVEPVIEKLRKEGLKFEVSLECKEKPFRK